MDLPIYLFKYAYMIGHSNLYLYMCLCLKYLNVEVTNTIFDMFTIMAANGSYLFPLITSLVIFQFTLISMGWTKIDLRPDEVPFVK